MHAPRLNVGDRIGIVSPSDPVREPLLDQYQRGIACLEQMGFRVVAGEHVRSITLGYAAAAQEKADDINRMFADPSIRAIICSQGGSTANACLEYLDWDLIRANPKIFIGISDITVLLNAIYHQTGLVTFHGNDVMWGFGRTPAAYDSEEFTARLVQGAIGQVRPNGERHTIRGGAAEGKLLGGNLHCLLKLAGTPYFPDFAGAILFVEALNITPESCEHLFTQLKHMGIFDQIAGVVIGYIDGLEDAPIQMHDVLLYVTPGHHFPILKTRDFGHNCPNTTLPVGARVRIDADSREIEIVEPCVL